MIIDDELERGILIVEDDDNFIFMINKILCENGYKKIFCASNGIEALSILEANEKEIYTILLDIYMPKLDGFGVIKHLVNVHKYPVGIIIVSIALIPGDKIIKLGNENVLILNYLAKPVELKTILSEVKKTSDLIYRKRIEQINISTQDFYNSLIDLKKSLIKNEDLLKSIDKTINEISKKQQGFLAQLGMDLLRAIIIALALLALLYFGIGDFIKSIIHGI